MVVLAKCAKGDCSALRAPAISAGIRNPGCRPAYSCWLGCQMYRQLCVQARGLSVRLTTLSGQKKNSCLLFLRDRSETSAVPLLLLSKNSLSIPSFFKYEKLTGNTLTGVNRTSYLEHFQWLAPGGLSVTRCLQLFTSQLLSERPSLRAFPSSQGIFKTALYYSHRFSKVKRI